MSIVHVAKDETRTHQAICQQIVEEARAAMETCNWKVGQLAVEWIAKSGQTDAEFGQYLGLSKKQVQQRRTVWERFGKEFELRKQNITWTHFRVCVAWADAVECLQWAADAEASVVEMVAWHRAQTGESTSSFSIAESDLDIVDDDDASDGLKSVIPVSEEIAAQKAPVQKPGASAAAEGKQAESSGKAQQRPSSGSGKPRENVRQPRNVDPEKFDVVEEQSHVISQLRDLAAPFCAAYRLADYVRAVRSHVDEVQAMIVEQEKKAN